MAMISSLSNPKVIFVRHLQSEKRFRFKHQQFVVEGTRWMGELLGKSILLQNVFYTENWQAQGSHVDLLAQLTGDHHMVTDEVMASMTSTETPPGILATAAFVALPIPKQLSLVLILDGITNPGNLGTILRTAAAAGVDAVLLTSGSVDIYNPKVVRGSMGALLRLPIHQLDWDKIEPIVDGMRVWVAAAGGTRSYTAIEWCPPAALIVGNEAHGASDDAYTLAEGSISIPMSRKTESLNAAIAAGIILFEAARQRDFPEGFS